MGKKLNLNTIKKNKETSITSIVSAEKNGLTVNAYIGIEMVMLAFNLEKNLTKGLAGFAIKCHLPSGQAHYLKNRITFAESNFKGYNSNTKPEERQWFDSSIAPFQYFRWLHVPSKVLSGTYTYEIIPMYFGSGTNKTKLTSGPSVRVSFELFNNHPAKFDYGFTRGYLSSQAYANKFNNKDIRPKGTKTIDYDTKPFEAQYEWLGGKVHKMLFDFLKDCASDSAEIKALIYDCDHPDFIERLKSFGKNLSVVLDDAPLHHTAGNDKPEDKVFKTLKTSTGGKVVRGHFSRFQHNKILIKLIKGKPVKVFCGSANFSIRGLYVQANNCMVISDSEVASKYNDYFDLAYGFMKDGGTGMEINKDAITQEWADYKGEGLPVFSLCLSPHKTSDISLKKVTAELKGADNSVLFSVMEMSGSGTPLQILKKIPKNIFHYGVTQSIGKAADDEAGDYKIDKYNKEDTVPFSYLKDKVPYPFRAEFSGGMGQVVHDKFIVIDFNSSAPVVFTGSSNLSSGGEESNGDNLLAIYDKNIAVAYAIEAVRLFDHYSFRYAMKKATKSNPLCLDNTDGWVKKYYDKNNRKCKDRILFGMKNTD
ncbi:MAG: phospholipase D-like domain-containing protein [bacterium]|nr:phospholipase D-like domain-containing protein [bacterium]